MGDCTGGKTRWKGKNASQVAQADPVSAMYELMKVWEIPRGLFANSAVLLQVNGDQAQLLSRTCFGRPYPPAVQPLFSASSCLDPSSTSERRMQLFQLGLEEAFYLSYDLRCINIYGQTPEGRVKLKQEDLWRLMQKSKKDFVQHYKAYSHLRSKRWVVLCGIQYGADFMAYQHHPALVHSDYAVLVMLGKEKKERLSRSTDLHGMLRLCGSVAKTLLLLHITSKGSQVDLTSPRCLENYNVEAVEVDRWIPEKHREMMDATDKVS